MREHSGWMLGFFLDLARKFDKFNDDSFKESQLNFSLLPLVQVKNGRRPATFLELAPIHPGQSQIQHLSNSSNNYLSSPYRATSLGDTFQESELTRELSYERGGSESKLERLQKKMSKLGPKERTSFNKSNNYESPKNPYSEVPPEVMASKGIIFPDLLGGGQEVKEGPKIDKAELDARIRGYDTLVHDYVQEYKASHLEIAKLLKRKNIIKQYETNIVGDYLQQLAQELAPKVKKNVMDTATDEFERADMREVMIEVQDAFKRAQMKTAAKVINYANQNSEAPLFKRSKTLTGDHKVKMIDVSTMIDYEMIQKERKYYNHELTVKLEAKDKEIEQYNKKIAFYQVRDQESIKKLVNMSEQANNLMRKNERLRNTGIQLQESVVKLFMAKSKLQATLDSKNELSRGNLDKVDKTISSHEETMLLEEINNYKRMLLEVDIDKISLFGDSSHFGDFDETGSQQGKKGAQPSKARLVAKSTIHHNRTNSDVTDSDSHGGRVSHLSQDQRGNEPILEEEEPMNSPKMSGKKKLKPNKNLKDQIKSDSLESADSDAVETEPIVEEEKKKKKKNKGKLKLNATKTGVPSSSLSSKKVIGKTKTDTNSNISIDSGSSPKVPQNNTKSPQRSTSIPKMPAKRTSTDISTRKSSLDSQKTSVFKKNSSIASVQLKSHFANEEVPIHETQALIPTEITIQTENEIISNLETNSKPLPEIQNQEVKTIKNDVFQGLATIPETSAEGKHHMPIPKGNEQHILKNQMTLIERPGEMKKNELKSNENKMYEKLDPKIEEEKIAVIPQEVQRRDSQFEKKSTLISKKRTSIQQETINLQKQTTSIQNNDNIAKNDAHSFESQNSTIQMKKKVPSIYTFHSDNSDAETSPTRYHAPSAYDGTSNSDQEETKKAAAKLHHQLSSNTLVASPSKIGIHLSNTDLSGQLPSIEEASPRTELPIIYDPRHRPQNQLTQKSRTKLDFSGVRDLSAIQKTNDSNQEESKVEFGGNDQLGTPNAWASDDETQQILSTREEIKRPNHPDKVNSIRTRLQNSLTNIGKPLEKPNFTYSKGLVHSQTITDVSQRSFEFKGLQTTRERERERSLEAAPSRHQTANYQSVPSVQLEIPWFTPKLKPKSSQTLPPNVASVTSYSHRSKRSSTDMIPSIFEEYYGEEEIAAKPEVPVSTKEMIKLKLEDEDKYLLRIPKQSKKDADLVKMYRGLLEKAQDDVALLPLLQIIGEQKPLSFQIRGNRDNELQINFQKFVEYHKKLVNDHTNQCGPNCTHIVRFYKRIGFSTSPVKKKRLELKEAEIPEIPVHGVTLSPKTNILPIIAQSPSSNSKYKNYFVLDSKANLYNS